MKAATLVATGQVVVDQVDDLSVGPSDVLIKVAYAGVCGSDLHSFEGTHPFRKPPVVLGHEVSGTVAQVGSQVHKVQIGDAVTVMPYRACGVCTACQRGFSNVCENKIVPGVKGWVGTFADYFLADEAITYKLGAHTSLKRGVLAEPFAVGIHSARRARMEVGESVLVLGAGTIGMLTAIAARNLGAETIVVTDLYAYNLGIARDMGFGAYDARDERLVEAILEDHPDRFDIIFLTGGAAVTVGQALALARRGGRIVATAIFPRPVLMSLIELTLYELELIGTQIYTHEDFRDALAWLDAGASPFDRLVDHEFPLDQAQEAVEVLAERKVGAIKVVLAP
ncbi:MAG: alcohol dehydrogenase catalytic domain-containing protein [Anaerolineae bacterium]|nr:alcohol dehydrogenase catalytic domain-containing protein [Anaerolineae bacterium]